MVHGEFELHLIRMKGSVEPGQIQMSDLGRVATALNGIRVRIARLVADQQTLGRPDLALGRLAGLRVTGLREGSTVLVLANTDTQQDPELFPVDDPDVIVRGDFNRKFDELIAGLSTGVPPEWVTPGVAESALDLLGALAHTCSEVSWVAPGMRHQFPTNAQRTAWHDRARVTGDVMTVSGELRKVDVDSGSFRITDDVGNRIQLDRVIDIDQAGRLVGTRVTATGSLMETRRPNGLLRLTDVVIDRDDHGIRGRATDEQLSDSVPFDGVVGYGPGFDREEIELLLAEIRS